MHLAGSEQAASSTLPWLVLGAVLGLALLALVALLTALVVRRRADRPPPPPERHDDLPAFLEHPPGSPGARTSAGSGWPALAALPAVGPATGARPRPATRTPALLAAACAVVLIGVGTAAALATVDRDRPDVADRAPERHGVEARLAFEGVVLERRAVGVTVTYPRLTLTSDRGRTTARLELPTHNCLSDRAPGDPVAAGCVRSQTLSAELTEPELRVDRDGEAVRVSGRFPIHLRPNGTPPEPTGAAYEVVVTVEPRPGEDDAGWVPADGTVELGDDRAPATGGSELRLGG
ncbi:hypothetical protein [Blastococcus sp. PRF04-17]|uniref:hypothetical protein n=1 Tax=Blastococcus sp. PRF04-17 TaxID=2933797 RepID=UPI001FF52F64|nr:hypothetical protein [Blastococcus sp. PRF04-17]UOY01246.1 hypothetical protein MVA48_20195 [Blastococcus sp. PRF04-17]